LLLGRREVFDIRAQLMAEDDPDHEELIISGLEEGDIKPKFYEGGFKTWECALDLAKLLTSSSDSTIPDAGDLHVIEMGCGTAMPSLAILARLLTLPVASSSSRRKVHFTLADYNSTVLRLVTLSNLLLTWKLNTTRQAGQHEDDGSQTEEDTVDEGGDELDIDSTFLDAFQNDLAQRAISIDFVSGAWSPRFVELALTSSPREEQVIPLNTIILASETIYAPSSLTPFSETLLDLLRRTTAVSASCRSEALIAAKKVYFGVGGGIDEFLHVLHQQPLKEKETIDVHQGVEVKTEGVGRVILQIGIQRS
jgi:protein-histidine N-methyltransferase